MHLESMGISETIQENNESLPQDRAQACIFLRKHIDDGLKFEYLTTDDPYVLWKDLKERFDNQKEVLLPSLREEWRSLRFQDFKRVNDYSSALFRICSQLKFCGQIITDADMLEKTFSTFHASCITLQQQLRLQRFTRYSELNAYLLVAEQTNELLMKNHNSRPTGSLAFPEANATNNDPRNHVHGQGRGRGQGRNQGSHNNYHGQNHTSGKNHNSNRGHPYGRGGFRGGFRGRGHGRNQRTNNYHAPQGNKKHDVEAGTSKNHEGSCFRCGSKDHWSRACRTPQHLCDLYKASVKGKEKEVNFVDQLDTEFNTSDFLDIDQLDTLKTNFMNDID